MTRPHRAYYLPDGTWVDPDCFECGGDGAPCCEPPFLPHRQRRHAMAQAHDVDAARDALLTAALKAASHRIYDERHPDDPAGAWQAELDDEVLLDAARAFALAADPGETAEQWKIWRRQPDGTITGHGTFYHQNGVEPFLARPDRWIVRHRDTHTWYGPWTDVPAALAPEGAPVVEIVPDVPQCPTCESPQPHLHPAVQADGGEVHTCPDPWHLTTKLGREAAARLAHPLPDAPEHPDVTAYLNECKAEGEAPEHDGGPS